MFLQSKLGPTHAQQTVGSVAFSAICPIINQGVTRADGGMGCGVMLHLKRKVPQPHQLLTSMVDVAVKGRFANHDHGFTAPLPGPPRVS